MELAGHRRTSEERSIQAKWRRSPERCWGEHRQSQNSVNVEDHAPQSGASTGSSYSPGSRETQRVRIQAPAPAPVVVNTPPVVNVPLVAAVIQAPVVVQTLVVENQDQVESPMEVEDEDSILERLFFKRYGRALPEKEKEKDKVDNIKFVIDLTDEKDEMEVAAPGSCWMCWMLDSEMLSH